MTWRIYVEPFTRPLFFVWSRLTRGKTLGVRAVAMDAQGRVLMVQHTYLAGWWLPGGGVDRGETTPGVRSKLAWRPIASAGLLAHQHQVGARASVRGVTAST